MSIEWMTFSILKDAIVALNGLQSNAATVQKSLARTHDSTCPNVKETEHYLNKIGISLDDLDGLSVIHVAGTKGKVRVEADTDMPNRKNSIYPNLVCNFFEFCCFVEQKIGFDLCTRRINTPEFEYQNGIFQFTASIACY